MTDDELTAIFRNRETLALLTWEPWMHNPKLKHRLHRIAVPTLFLRGESDGLVSPDYLEPMRAPAERAQRRRSPSAGHVPQLEQPEAFAAAVLKFLGE